jgi:hypothetical protein
VTETTEAVAAVDDEEFDPRAHYTLNTPAWQVDGRWIDPDTLEPVTYDVPDGHPEGMAGWRVTDLRRFRDEGPDGPTTPYEDPERTAKRNRPALDQARREQDARDAQDRHTELQLAQPITNVDLSDRPHFILNNAGVEVCGQDGEPWPCQWWTGEVEPTALEHSTGQQAPAAPPTPTREQMVEAARALGMDPDDVETMLMRNDAADR